MQHHCRFNRVLPTLAAALLSLFIQGAVAARPAGDLPVVSGQAALTISGSGYWHREMYQDGDSPAISAYDASGQLLPDGAYRYEYRETQSGRDAFPTQLELLDGGAGASDAKKKPKGKSRGAKALSGRFLVQGGSVTFQ